MLFFLDGYITLSPPSCGLCRKDGLRANDWNVREMREMGGGREIMLFTIRKCLSQEAEVVLRVGEERREGVEGERLRKLRGEKARERKQREC